MSFREELQKAMAEKMSAPAPTAKAPEPGSEGAPKEPEGQAGTPPPAKEAGKEAVPGDGKEKDEKLPFDQHPKWKSARETEKKVQDLLEANDLDNFEELVDLLKTGKEVKGRVRDLREIDQALDDSKTLARYRAYWKQQERMKRDEAETPEQKTARLEAEKRELETRLNQRTSQDDEVRAAEEALKTYTKAVDGYVNTLDIPENAKPFFKKWIGVDNPFNEVDITDEKAVKKMARSMFKEWQDLEQAIIKNYLAKKQEAPPITPAAPAAPEPVKRKDFKLKEARAMLVEQAMSAFKGSLGQK